MSNLTYVYVIRRHILEGVDERTLAEEMNMKVSNIYNLKRRAMAALTKIALNDVKNYAKKRY
jgi:predicted metal-dependent hydrolase